MQPHSPRNPAFLLRLLLLHESAGCLQVALTTACKCCTSAANEPAAPLPPAYVTCMVYLHAGVVVAAQRGSHHAATPPTTASMQPHALQPQAHT